MLTAVVLQVLLAQYTTSLGFSLVQLRRQDREHRRGAFDKRDTDLEKLYSEHSFSVPIDHFHNDSLYAPHGDEYFDIRYWFDASYYQKGGPVFVVEGGETDASERLPYLQKGIAYEVIKATNGLGVVSHCKSNPSL